MSSVRVTKSRNFDRNLNSQAMMSQIKKNTWAGSEILKQTSNNIAPILTGKLRQNTTAIISSISSGFRVVVTWLQPYSGLRYTTNHKNPQTRYWVQKGYNKKKATLLKIMQKGVIL